MGRLLDSATVRLRQAGVEDARLEAELLLGKALGLGRPALYAHPERVPEREPLDRFERLLAGRLGRRPLQQLLGEWEFCGRRFRVSEAVMAPRQETELVVAKCLEKLESDAGAWIADAGTGSGVIAVTLAAERPNVQVIATDVSEGALELAAHNASDHGVAGRVRLVQGDLLEPVRRHLPDGVEGLDMVVSNPPYVPTAEIASLAPEVRDHEPRAALDGGPDGLDVVRRLVPQAGSLLAPGGWLVIELGPGQAREALGIAACTGDFEPGTAQTVTDGGGCERVFCVRKRSG